jgi:hypothetical protein
MNNNYQYNYDTFRLQQAELLEKARQQQQAQDLLTQLNTERNQGSKEKRKRH